ncbi:hypothetical protein BDQ17DRAFT_1438674 [Cyathus striatus]|nr:hypothetical protein BDQ17DRAFT_1438674 [Cyathus striatus]
MELVQLSLLPVSNTFQLKPVTERFLHDIPTHSVSNLNMLPIPSAAYINQLYAFAGQAMLNGTISIEIDQECERILVPFEALGYWSYANKAISAQLKWKQGLSWLKGHEHQSPAFAALAQDAISLLS